MNKNILTAGIVALLFAGAGAYFGSKQQAGAVPPPSPAVNALLSQSMPDASGTEQALSHWKGKALIVNFWATWCAPCVDEMPELSALQTRIASDGIHIVGIGIDTQPNIAAFAEKYKIAYPLYVGGLGATKLTRELGNQTGGLPFTLLIDSHGSVRKTYLGRLNMDELRKDLALLQDKA
jgi:thiol-disulfide isomerase/thioredoxin